MSNLAIEVIDAAKARGWMIATAESCTGGMVSAALTDIAGSSAVVDRGFVTYSNAAKVKMLDVSLTSLHLHGAVSETVAREMAIGALAVSDADVTVAITGVAGPGGSDEKPEGLVHFAVAAGDYVLSNHCEFGAIGRDNVRKASVEHALKMLLTAIQDT
ncbi:nicotinamide-nucleotide amidase [Monaibacterium marinum]|uniref:Nicotinamide-nucleotide amidase n=1 Tax=Pontivivens marinum TaxID=1690039 RepID=A0A2C9CR02_9RHOB|nr:CinA family protein [Monaibacterium marinum]SOH93672.1 nicotinamide-nucleotide amidase [Monaibacterium marinum]